MLTTINPFSSISLYGEGSSMSSWQVLHLLYIAFKNLYLDERNEQVYIRVQVNLGVPENEAQYIRVTGDTLEEAVSTATASLWRYLPEDIKDLLQETV